VFFHHLFEQAEAAKAQATILQLHQDHEQAKAAAAALSAQVK
jgi:hypothetical protein